MERIGFDVRYRAIDVASQVVLTRVGPTVAFVGVDNPVPVGTQVTLIHGERSLPATVIRSVEPLKGRSGASGLWVRVELDDAARELWEPLVEGEDEVIPEPVGTAVVQAPDKIERLRAPDAEPDAETAEVAPAEGAEVAPADGGEAASDSAEVAAEGGRDAGGPREAKSTQIMSAVDIREALGQEPVVDQGTPRELDAGSTQPMGTGAIAKEAGGKKKKKKKRRRRR
jgi:hypothetical protein